MHRNALGNTIICNYTNAWEKTAVSPPSGGKRKAELLNVDDSENVDPIVFSKRSKGNNSVDYVKPANFVLKRAAATPLPDVLSLSSPIKGISSPRRTLQPKSPMAKLNTASVAKSSPISAPAGRSPTHGKRAGLLGNRRRASGPFTRVDPPAFNLGSASTPFSLDAALKGTIPSYTSRQKGKARQSLDSLVDNNSNPNWFFDIHEDTPEQEMTNLLQHGTCVLDISSDEETERKATREDGGDKENVPPPGDSSQTSSSRSAATSENIDDMVLDKERTALGEMNVADFYPEGHDDTSVVLVPADDEEHAAQAPTLNNFEFAPEVKSDALCSLTEQDPIESLMAQPTDESSDAAVLQPIEGTGESFELWESGSSKDETEELVVAST